MCGISCIYDFSRRTTPDGDHSTAQTNGSHSHPRSRAEIARSLDASLDSIKHRGPDARGQWISPDNRVALGHVRLSINDLSPSGSQPLHSPSGHTHAVVNGELYDYDSLRSGLESRHGWTFASRSDSELLVALYEVHGLDFLQYLRGEYACVMWDSRRKVLVAARDRYGIKPMFWTVTPEGRLLLAAEMKAFLSLGWVPEWDVGAMRDGSVGIGEMTVFKGVQKIHPGHYLICRPTGHTESRPYWDMQYANKHIVDTRTLEEMVEGVRERLLNAVRVRLRADVPIGIYLSGGIDSSVIAGMVTHLVKEQGVSLGSSDPKDRIRCFSIAFDEASGFDESSIANRTAEWLGVKIHKKHMSEAELAKRFEDAVWHIEQTSADLNFVGKFALSEVPQEVGHKVVLTGEGADENFAGYPLYFPDFLREPDPAGGHLAPMSDAERLEALAEAEAAAVDHYVQAGADVSNRGDNHSRRMLNNITTVASLAAYQPDIFAPWTATAFGTTTPVESFADNIDGVARTHMQKDWHPLHAALYTWSKAHLPNLLLTCLGDRTEMAHSIEARTPFLDHELTQYVNHLPPSVKLHWVPEEKRLVEKWVLREAARPFITKELYERKKQPYLAPTSYPVGGPMEALMRRLVTRERVKELGFVDWEKVEAALGKAFAVEGGNARAMRTVVLVAELVVLGKKFGVRAADGS